MSIDVIQSRVVFKPTERGTAVINKHLNRFTLPARTTDDRSPLYGNTIQELDDGLVQMKFDEFLTIFGGGNFALYDLIEGNRIEIV